MLGTFHHISFIATHTVILLLFYILRLLVSLKSVKIHYIVLAKIRGSPGDKITDLANPGGFSGSGHQ